MKIKELDITGFKSFVDRTTFSYEPGITAVVGPNGCGKSNVVDAIRWVMGEQSPKHLRGKDMEDVIFGGSDGRKPLGMAEVSITFSNEDGNAPEAYRNCAEIMVTRRLFRSGESEYLINKVPCRLKDITELFMGTGIGTRAYSIVEQGQIGLILNSKPQDRRFLIEEAAGITKYKSKKKEALAKMESTRQNLQRVNDIVGEVKRQMNGLDRQAKKAEKFRAYRSEIKEIELKLSSIDYMRLAASLLSEESRFRAMEEEGISMETRVSGYDSEIETLRTKLMVDERVLADLQERFYTMTGELQKKEDRIEHLRSRKDSIDKQGKKFSEELEQLKANAEKAEGEIGSIQEEIEENRNDQEGVSVALSKKTEELDSYKSVYEEKARGLEALKSDMVKLAGELAHSRNAAANLERRIEESARRIEKSRIESEGVDRRISEINKEMEALNARVVETRTRKDELTAERDSLTARIASLRTQQKETELLLRSSRDELLKKSSHLNSLETLQDKFEGYGEGVKAIKLSDNGKRYTVVADIFETTPEFETALEAALGARLQHLVIDDPRDGIDGISYLRSKSAGRCGFINQSAVSSRKSAISSDIDAVPLSGKVKVRAGYENVAKFLLGDTFVIDSLEKASLLADSSSLRLVTYDGDLVEDGGIMVGGSMEVLGHGILQRKREIKELQEAVGVLKDQVQETEDVLKGIVDEIGESERRLEAAKKELHQVEIEAVHLAKDCEKHNEEIKRLTQRLEVMRIEEEHLFADKAGFEEELFSENEKLNKNSVLKEEREASIRELQEELLVYKGETDRISAEVTDLRVQVTSLKGREQTLKATLERVVARRKELLERASTREEEITEGSDEILDIDNEIFNLKKGVASLIADKDRLEERLIKAREVYQAEAEKLKVLDGERQRSAKELEALRKDINSTELAVSKLRLEMGNIAARINESYNTSIEEAVAIYREQEMDEAGLSDRQKELAGLIEGLGEVNLTAIEEYQGLEERYTFLTEQQADLNRSIDSLQTAIQRINSISRERFKETFEAVNENFKVVFKKLFRGGRAEMSLVESDDLLEAGIDIIVQPPGKRLQGVSLLSGGEKALTAVSLIFSIFLLKPTPFCLLDEVDAPLDEANVGRFNEMVEEMSQASQFILITHNKRTMEIADVLYGITMQEPGVSRLVSVRLKEEEAQAA